MTKNIDNNKMQFDTLAIHAGEVEDGNQALTPPIYMSSTFTFQNVNQVDDTFNMKREGYVYTRGGNPTINLFERRIAALEKGTASVAFSSGMAAVSSVLLSLTKQGDRILAHNNLYGCTYNAMAKLLPQYGITTDFVDLTNPEKIYSFIKPETRLLYLETPTNPSLDIVDIEAMVKIAHKANIKTVVDNTFATPYLQRPLEMGVDIVLHSATKYFSGHGDVVGGVVTAKDAEYIELLKSEYMCELGGVMSPFNAWLLLRGLKTLGLRVQRHSQNALELAEFLVKHPKVARVFYPGLSSHPGYAVAKKQMSAFGGIVSFELHGDAVKARQLVENMHLAKLAVSLGDAETLIEIPALMTHRKCVESGQIEQLGFTPKTIRVALGLEDSKDIINDFAEALVAI